MTQTSYDYDLFVIGGGSGGVRAARLAAQMGHRVAVAEYDDLGGTCVNRGCVPKKLMVYAGEYAEHFEDAAGYGWTIGETSFDWNVLKRNRDAEVRRLNGIYQANLEKAGVEILRDTAVFDDAHTIRLVNADRTVTADKVLIAVGGYPNPHDALEGHELCITSDAAFDLAELPKKIIIAGGGYIAIEFACIFNALGVEVTVLYRGLEILQHFDMDVRRLLHAELENKGIKIITKTVFEKVERNDDGGLRATLSDGACWEGDQIMLALGRLPSTEKLGLDKAGVQMDRKGCVLVDEHLKTSADNVYALGDVIGRVPLTPVAIHEAMCFIETVFKGNPTKPDYVNIPTAVFSHPQIATVGMSEDEAEKNLENFDVYKTIFRPMRNILAGRPDRMLIKLLVNADDDTVVGAHILGPEAGETAQLIGIAIKACVKKAQFDATMAVHPTAAEELVTMYEPTYRVRKGEKVAA
ncbi:glutathione-disulfide reductase [Aurantimonas sp. C2-6-R+9]|uniref:glutathione-disulfide reductase n=1 Tax=unclassified Aurantimonas TaxID=2638230 RepID=UPI002E18CC20|nr:MULTISPECIES: glutathione-disulfide reductase [unclassified Aurantimonas]MEC5289919.1 glutathione-disulfide reductase [Aurantimonas sp. C2-3-R2]MEC5379941.1 glutathione-disulfide reductase [Aurantimonas sp. C2-6-R+9]MEC5411001.1 glutathione-disulfide reductase [Aurantimonas sp. C2-4-R8]